MIDYNELDILLGVYARAIKWNGLSKQEAWKELNDFAKKHFNQ